MVYYLKIENSFWHCKRSNEFASNSAVNATNLGAGQNTGTPDAHAQGCDRCQSQCF